MKSKTTFLILLSVGLVFATVGMFFKPGRAQTWVEGHITQDTTWTVADSPHVVINDVIVDANATLTIEAGVEVRFGGDFSLTVEGSLYAVGSEGLKIVFTSNKLEPAKGDWRTIKYSGEANSTFYMKYATIEFATSGITLDTHGEFTIEESTITENSENGVALVPWLFGQVNNVTIRSCTISDNDRNAIYADLHGGRSAENIEISNNIIKSSTTSYWIHGNGIMLEGYGNGSDYRNIVISNNTIHSNYRRGIYCRLNNHAEMRKAVVSENIIRDNGQSGILFAGESTWGYNWGYNVSISENYIRNNMDGIVFSGLSSHNITIERNTLVSNFADGMSLQPHYNSSNFTVKSNIFSSNDRGIYVGGGAPSGPEVNLTYFLSNNSVSHNTYGVYISTNKISGIHFNDIYGNTYGMNITSHQHVTNAEYNYWGDSSGPYHPSLNPTGDGNPVNGDGTDLDFIPFLTSPVGTINQRPIAILDVDKTNVNADETVAFDATGSTDDGRIDYYFFDFGDGTDTGWTPLSVVTHKYSSEDTYNATLIVMDDFGVSSINMATKTIFVGEFPSLNVLLTLNPIIIGSEGQVSVNVHVTDGTIAIENASVQLVSDTGGNFAPSSGYTDLNGDFSATFTSPSVSEETDVGITATASKSGYSDGSDYEYVSVVPPEAPGLSVTVTANPSIVESGESSTITVEVADGVSTIPDATVTLFSDDGGTFSQESGNTDSNGVFTSTFTAPSVTQQTTCTIAADATKAGYVGDQGQTQVTVKPPPVDEEEEGIELFLILIAVAVISIVVVAVALIARKGRSARA